MGAMEDIIKELRPEFQRKVQDLAASLLDRQKRHPRPKPRFDWAGALEDMKDQYTSVELQHRISRLRVGDE